jgi:hypothetical protein
MLRFRFLDPDTGLLVLDQSVENCSITQALGKSGEWRTVIPATTAEVDLLARGCLVEIYYQGKLLMSGHCQTRETGFQADSNTVTLFGRDGIDRLYDQPGYSMALYKDVPLLLALGDLLHQAGWRLGDVSTIPSPETVKINLDLRREEQLLTQITKVCETVTKLSYRYGGMVNSLPTLDFGYFNQKSGISFVSAPADDRLPNDVDGILTADDTVGYDMTLTFNEDLSDVIWGMEAWGGEATDAAGKRQISLYDTVSDNPALPTDPDFPVIEQLYKNKYLIWDLHRCKYPGGVSQHNQEGAETNIQIGNPTGGAGPNNQYAIWMYPTPGRLTTVYIDASGVAGLGTLTNPLTWWLHEAGTYPTPGAVIATGTINGGSFVLGGRLVFDLPDGIIIEPGVEYCWRVGYDYPGGLSAGTYVRLKATNVTCTTLTSRQARTLNNGGTYSTYTTSVLPLTVITERIGTPLGGGRLGSLAESNTGNNTATATAADLKAAGRQLRQWCIAYMEDRKGERTTYNLTVAGDVIPPQIGDSVYVRGVATGSTLDPFTEIAQEYRKIIEGDFRVESLQLDFQTDQLTLAAALSNGNGLTNQDIYVQLYSSTRRNPVQGTVYWGMRLAQMSTATHTVAGGAADTVMFSDGSPGKLFTIPLPTAPAYTYYLTLLGLPYGVSSRGYVNVEIVSFPTFTTGAIIRLNINKNWTAADSVNLTCNYLWY